MTCQEYEKRLFEIGLVKGSGLFISDDQKRRVLDMDRQIRQEFGLPQNRVRDIGKQADRELLWLIVNWNPNGVIENGFVSLKGPQLRISIEEVRDKLQKDSPRAEIECEIDRLLYLFIDGAILSASAVVQCGIVHTS